MLARADHADSEERRYGSSWATYFEAGGQLDSQHVLCQKVVKM